MEDARGGGLSYSHGSTDADDERYTERRGTQEVGGSVCQLLPRLRLHVNQARKR